MGIWKKKSKRPQAAPQVQRDSAASGDPRMPGIAGYQGIGGLPKNAMPDNRFRFVRPDGKPED